MTTDIGLEIALLGAMDRIRADAEVLDFPGMLASTRRLQDLFAEADRAKLHGLMPLAQEARDLLDQVLAGLGTQGAALGAARYTGPRTAYATVEGLPR